MLKLIISHVLVINGGFQIEKLMGSLVEMESGGMSGEVK